MDEKDRYILTMRCFLYLLLILPALLGCSGDRTGESLVIMSWNVQNLFDDVDNGTEYYEFDPANGEWDYDKFNRKAFALADVICRACEGGADIVLLQEVENENALRHLNENCLKASAYKYSLYLPTEGSAVGMGLLSRYPPQDVKSHSVNLEGSVRGRNISEICFYLAEFDQQLLVFANHWKSKLGGAEETEVYRVAAAEKLSSLIEAASAVNPSLLIVAAGDFNESHDEWARVEGRYPTAVTADGLSGTRLFNPWNDCDGSGSYYYEGWETIDQFFLSDSCIDGSGLDYVSFFAAVVDFNSTEDGRPLAWRNSDGTGCSDHFPILLELGVAAQDY